MTENMTRNERNLELVRRIQAGDLAAAEELVVENEGLVGKFVKRISPSPADHADFMNAGRYALINAALHFDAARGIMFSTYAFKCINRCCFRLRTRRGLHEKHMDCVREEMRRRPLGYHEDFGADEEAERLRLLLQSALARLDLREVTVIRGYFGFETGGRRSLEDIGRQIGVTYEATRQVKLRALRKLAAVLAERGERE